MVVNQVVADSDWTVKLTVEEEVSIFSAVVDSDSDLRLIVVFR